MGVSEYYLDAVRSAFMTRLDLSEAGYVRAEAGSRPPSGTPYYAVDMDAILDRKLPDGLAKELKPCQKHDEEDEGADTHTDLVNLALVLSYVKKDEAPADALLIVPVQMLSGGRLIVPWDWTFTPVIPRDFLAEDGEDLADGPYIGTYGAYRSFIDEWQKAFLDQFKDANDQQEWETAWNTYLDFCFSLYESVAGHADNLPIEHARARGDVAYVLEDKSVNATRSIIDLYKWITAGHPQSNAYRRFIGELEDGRPGSAATLSAAEQMKLCRAAPDTKYPLCASQRQAVVEASAAGPGSIVAVSGPPGTGKTTLLKSVVANELVRCALDGELPPVIVATSTNNRTITNVTDEFATAGQADKAGGLFERWLPDPDDARAPLRSLSVYVPSEKKRKAAREKGYLTDRFRLPADKGNVDASYPSFYDEMSNADSLAKAKEFFGEKAVNGLERPGAIRACLARIDRLRCDLIDAVAGGHEGKAEGLIKELNGSDLAISLPDDICTDLAGLGKALETTVCPVEFWLAIHYYEALWLEGSKDSGLGRRLPREWRGNTFQENERSFHRQLACLTPVQVMTPYLLAREFQVYKDGITYPETPPIDLLIIDEAGQVDSPIVAPALALAKRAVVVGDGEQLEPVWGREPEEDLRRYRGLSPECTSERFEELRTSGRAASKPSSCMVAAQMAAGNRHVLLREHFRCKAPIISFCNELAYEGKLIPSRIDEEGSPASTLSLPPMSRIPVDGASSRSLGSRANCNEAKAVLDWIDEHFDGLCEHYGRKDEDRAGLLGIVTPYKAQAELIKKGLGERQLSEDIVCDTVHALQGGECNVILFSLVLGSIDKTGFVEDQPNLMNVAVSRAKDAFVLFANPEVLQKAEEGSVIGLLAKHCPEHTVEDAPAASLTQHIRQWKADDPLFEGLRAAEVNKMLNELGYLVGRPGDWDITDKGAGIGMRLVQKTRDGGEVFEQIEYTDAAAEALREVLAARLRDN